MVFRNHLMELLQYEPQTEQVHATPLLASPPWINKYYVMDLAPGRSFIEWAVQHGRTVFAISYINPTADMSGHHDGRLPHPRPADRARRDQRDHRRRDDRHRRAVPRRRADRRSPPRTCTQAGDSRVGTLTLLNTMLDYAEPGALGTFTDLATVEKLERKMRREGTLEGASMAGTFDILRANDLIFNYVVSNWLMGQKPPAFDILAWNADSTRMPAAMHAFYLRNFYIENKLAKGTLEIAGRTVDLSVIKSPTYIVCAINDHIVPWESAYKTVGLVSGPVRFVLGSGGHIAGIVSPPGPKAWHMVGAENVGRRRPEWREGAERASGSWWEDWARLVGRALGRDGRPAAHGQRRPPRARRRAGGVRAHLIGRLSSRRRPPARRAGVSIAALAPPGVVRAVRRARGMRLRAAIVSAASIGCRLAPRSRTVELDARPTTLPPGPKTGTATPQAPASSSKRVTATRVSRVTARARRKRSGEVTVCAVYGRSPRMIVMSTTPGGEKASRARPSAVGWAGSVAAGLNDVTGPWPGLLLDVGDLELLQHAQPRPAAGGGGEVLQHAGRALLRAGGAVGEPAIMRSGSPAR